MYQQETITKELHLQLSDEDLAQFELDAKETERLGHIGTHMDCYMEAPRYKEYVTDAVVVDCRNGLPADEYFNNLIRALGPFENLLLVTGENPRAAGVDYIEQALKVCRPYFNNLTIEVMPLASEDYYRLTQSGLNGVVS